MVAQVKHPVWQWAYRCECAGCKAGPYRWRDQAEDCERFHRYAQQRQDQAQQPDREA